MRIYVFLSFSLLLGFIHCEAQSYFRIEVYDNLTRAPIENVRITLSGNESFTNDRGFAEFKSYPFGKITFSHISYRDTSIIFHEDMKLPFQIFLKPNTQQLKTAEVNTKPYEIFAPETTNVFDFEWIHDSLLVLTYKKEQMMRKAGRQSHSLYLQCQLYLVGPHGSILDSIPLPDYIQSFYRDPLNQVFILSDTEVFIVQIISGHLAIQKIDSENFQHKIAPLNGESTNKYFFDNYTRNYPEFSHFSLSKDSQDQKCIRTLSDSFTMELFRAEYKYMSNYDKLRAIRLEQKSGVDKEIIAAYMRGFPQSLYYHPIYAPLFSVGDSVYIFDPCSKNIYIHDGNGSPVDSIGIHFLNVSKGKFNQRILLDRSNETFYAVFKYSGILYLKRIFIQTGKASSPIHLYYKYPEKIKVFQGKVYYLYRRTGSDNTKHLFAERLE